MPVCYFPPLFLANADTNPSYTKSDGFNCATTNLNVSKQPVAMRKKHLAEERTMRPTVEVVAVVNKPTPIAHPQGCADLAQHAPPPETDAEHCDNKAIHGSNTAKSAPRRGPQMQA